MKVIRTASGKTKIKMSKNEWRNLGIKQGWIKKAQYLDEFESNITENPESLEIVNDAENIEAVNEPVEEKKIEPEKPKIPHAPIPKPKKDPFSNVDEKTIETENLVRSMYKKILIHGPRKLRSHLNLDKNEDEFTLTYKDEVLAKGSVLVMLDAMKKLYKKYDLKGLESKKEEVTLEDVEDDLRESLREGVEDYDR